MFGIVSKTDIRNKVQHLNDRYGFDFFVEWAYGKPRVYESDGRELSPRLSTGQLLLWLHAFEKGLEIGHGLRKRK